VSDASPELPVRKDAAPGEESGRGLLLVETLSDWFGWYRPDDGTPGKRPPAPSATSRQPMLLLRNA